MKARSLIDALIGALAEALVDVWERLGLPLRYCELGVGYQRTAASERCAQVSKFCRRLVRPSVRKIAVLSLKTATKSSKEERKALAESRYEKATSLMSMETTSI